MADKAKMKHSDNMSPTKLSDIRPLKKRKVQFSTGKSLYDFFFGVGVGSYAF